MLVFTAEPSISRHMHWTNQLRSATAGKSTVPNDGLRSLESGDPRAKPQITPENHKQQDLGGKRAPVAL